MWLEPWVHTGNKFHATQLILHPAWVSSPGWTGEKHVHTCTFCPRGLDCECGLQNRSLGEGTSSTACGCSPRLDGAWTVPAKAPVFITIAVFLQCSPWNGCKAPLLTSRSGQSHSSEHGQSHVEQSGDFSVPRAPFFFSQISLHLFLIGKSEIEQADIFPTNVAVP